MHTRPPVHAASDVAIDLDPGQPGRPAHASGRSAPKGRAATDSERVIPFAAAADLAREELVASVVPRERSERVNRIVNVVLAALALLVLAPVLAITAILVKATSPGPIIYSQIRVGEDRRRRSRGTATLYDRRVQNLGGRVFMIYKFRSMRNDAERGTGAVWASHGDARVTPVGRLLRKCRLDEVPQLVNVLKGDMNIVGPRPERPSIFQRLRDGVEGYPLRQLAKPGITGWAQINQSYDTTLEDVRSKVRYDLEYLGRQGMTEDLRIMLQTVPVVLFRRGGW
jgi:lipopolysaccharide/colanic/teichoic acid biosynthesis glycosyltransferase